MITILMATYNGENYIAEQIESILKQTETQWNLIIQDDCSTDNTLKIVQEYALKYPQKINFRKQEDSSGSAKNNFSSMLSLSNSEYIMTCDQDDIWLPNKIELTIRKMHELEKNVGRDYPLLVHTDLKVVDEKLNLIAESMLNFQNLDSTRNEFNNLLAQNIVTGCSMMINRSLLNKVRKIPEEAIMHDWWLALIASAFGKIGFVEEPTILYRQHSSNEVGAQNMKSLIYKLKRLSNHEQTKLALLDTYAQAKAFLDQYASYLPAKMLDINKEYISIPTYQKIRRIQTVKKYDFWKTGFTRKCGQVLFI